MTLTEPGCLSEYNQLNMISTTFKTDFDCNNLKHKFFKILLTSLFSSEQHLQHFKLNLYGKFENEKKNFYFTNVQ